MVSDEWDELERLAKAATPGEWASDRTSTTDEPCIRASVPVYPTTDVVARLTHLSGRDAAFIAAANPATVLRLIEQLRAAAVQVEALRGANERLVVERDTALRTENERLRAARESGGEGEQS